MIYNSPAEVEEDVLVILYTSTDIRDEVLIAPKFPDERDSFPGKWGSRDEFLAWAGPGARWATDAERQRWVDEAHADRAALMQPLRYPWSDEDWS